MNQRAHPFVQIGHDDFVWMVTRRGKEEGLVVADVAAWQLLLDADQVH